MTSPLPRLSAALADRYRIERELGAGGMATVYLAHDVRHDRRVALKVLRPELAAVIGGDRFLQEIKVTANLQHPHILPLHDSGQLDGTVFYVMPYVEGESLRTRLDREKQLPVDVAIRITTEIASALDYAHRHGVIHRDIKPENILLHDGSALVADFGIALAVTTAGGHRMTETGLSLGTPHYMSPEQAMGEREITPKSDVYALGCVLYEMLLGEPPFTGPTAQAIIARVMTDAPRSPMLQRKTIPAHVDRALLKALEKLPADRFESAAAFADALNAPGSPPTPPPSVAAFRARRRSGPVLFAAVAMIGLAAGVLAGRLTTRGGDEIPVARFSIPIPAEHRMPGSPFLELALSPDGKQLVYVGENVGGTQLFLRRLGELTPTAIAGTDGASSPTFSRDGQSLAFLLTGQLYRMRLGGGTAVKVASTGNIQSALWSGPDEFIVTAADGSLGRLKGNGSVQGIAAPIAKDGEGSLVAHDILPDGRVLAIAVKQARVGPLIAIEAKTGARETISSAPTAAAWYDAGFLLWVQQDGTLLGAPFEPGRPKLETSVRTIATDVRAAIGGVAQVAFSRRGSLIYAPSLPSELVLVDRTGRAQPLSHLQRRFHGPRVSPDGRRVAVDYVEQSDRDVWLVDLRDQTSRRLTFDKDGHDPTWMPGGEELLYHAARGGSIGIMKRRADGSGKTDSILVIKGGALTAHTVTPDGRVAIAVNFGETSTAGGFDLVSVTLEGEHKMSPVLNTTYGEGWPSLSPDGHLLAYASDESGRSEIYVRPFPGPGGSVLVSQNGGSEPVWSRNGRELFFRGYGTKETMLISTIVETRPDFRIVSRTPLFSVSDYEAASPHANFDVTPDGHFVMVRQAHVTEIVLVQNWKELIRREGASANR